MALDNDSHAKIVRDAIDEITRLQSEVERLRGRVSQLEVATLNAIQAMPGGQAKADLRDAYDEDVPAFAWLLRKQAEAVTGAYYAILDDLPDAPKFEYCRIVLNALDKNAQRLRQQATELERG